MISAIITGAGSSTRFGENKMLSSIQGKPVLYHTLSQFIGSGCINEIIVTCRKEDEEKYEEIVSGFGSEISIRVVEGGSERIISLMNGLNASNGDYIVTHDGARPLASKALIRRVVEMVKKHDAVMTAINPTATVKMTGEENIIQRTLPRKKTWIAQTPQAFKRSILHEALKKAVDKEYFTPTDDSEIVSIMTGHPVHVTLGEVENIKITYPVDIKIINEIKKEGLSK
jgi:2-C-methyl-D-erythritol 4-phosphate cytidylyltransferase